MWLYPVPIGIEPVLGGGACNRELPRILLLRRWVNKDDHARLRFLVNEEHAGPKPVRCGPEADLGVYILCGPRSSKSLYASTSSRGVNLSRALGFTMRLIAA
jgi:hypothetical protein